MAPPPPVAKRGGGGVPRFFVTPNLSEPYDNSFLEKKNPAERKKEEREITPLMVDTFRAP
jgi:hypothetical protein